MAPRARGARQSSEIDVRGQIRVSRGSERIDIGVARHRLQTFAKRCLLIAVVNEQQRAAVGDEPRGDVADELLACGAHFDD